MLTPRPLLADKHAKTPPVGAYRLSSLSLEEDVPLSMRFMHKPLRALAELTKASDPTRRNSLLNAARPDGSPLIDLTLSDSDGERLPTERFRLVRKKLGEIVKPSLKEPLLVKHRLKSLPLTPTYKQVHFGGDTDVRYFKKKDRPTAISAQNSPELGAVDDDDIPGLEYDTLDDSDAERRTLYFDYFDDELNSHADRPARDRPGNKPDRHVADTRYPRVDWELHLLDFPKLLYHDNILTRHTVVFLERVFLSVDNKYLLGHVAVMNLAYEKHVTVRYSLDSWATIVEIPTVYVPDVPQVLKDHNYDRFIFKISLDSAFAGFNADSDYTPQAQERGYQLCIRYTTPDNEFWDNNALKNYLIRLRKRVHQPRGPPGPAQPEMPTTARTKQETHTRRPKYSSLYLKRIMLDPTMATSSPSDEPAAKFPSPPEEFAFPAYEASPSNDFEQNDFYLLLPLLLSYNNKDTGDVFHLNDALLRESVLRAGFGGSLSPAPRFAQPHAHLPSPELSPNEDAPETEISPQIGLRERQLLDLMLYKELLDSYCFLTSSSQDNSSKTTLVLSDDPGTAMPAKDKSTNAYSVLLFLRD